MLKLSKILMFVALTLAIVQPGLANESKSLTGAKSLFGQGNEEIFYPREQAGRGGSAARTGELVMVTTTATANVRRVKANERVVFMVLLSIQSIKKRQPQQQRLHRLQQQRFYL